MRAWRSVCLIALTCTMGVTALRAENGKPPLPVAKADKVGMSQERLDRIAPAMQRYIDRKEVPGVVTLVARKGKLVHFEVQGERNVEANAPMSPDTIFRIASMTKPITSVALMMLYEEGHFLLNDPVAKYLPAYSEMKVAVPPSGEARVATPYELVEAERPITVRHMLTHTAGLANSYRAPHRAELAKLSERQRPEETIGEFVDRLATLPLNYQPGEAWEYSRATDVVGRLVEVMSGMTLDEFFQKRIFEPLGMNDTHFYLPKSKLDRFAAQYRPGEGGGIALVDAPTAESRFVKEPHTYFMGAGGLVSTAGDYARFLQMMLNGGELDGVRLLSPKTVQLMTANHTGDLPIWLTGPGYGFGLGFSVLKDVGEAGVAGSEGTYGWGGAYCTYFWVDPVEEMFGILMTQVRPYDHLNIRQEFQVLANQAIVESKVKP